ncbi:MAG: site-2 protease family protein [Fidelibacterota bacterium]
MLFRLDPSVLALLLPVLLFALVFHEFSHAWMAHKLGDDTAAYQGRLTLNPMAHLDLMGSIMILFVGFGWAKPVPVNPAFLRNPRSDMMKIAFAGPASNLFLAFTGGLLFRLIASFGGHGGTIMSMLYIFVQINIMLAVFNLIPIPPLDGSQIFSGLMSRRNPQLVMKLQMYGPQILLGLILFGMISGFSILWLFMKPFVTLFMYLFIGS